MRYSIPTSNDFKEYDNFLDCYKDALSIVRKDGENIEILKGEHHLLSIIHTNKIVVNHDNFLTKRFELSELPDWEVGAESEEYIDTAEDPHWLIDFGNDRCTVLLSGNDLNYYWTDIDTDDENYQKMKKEFLESL